MKRNLLFIIGLLVICGCGGAKDMAAPTENNGGTASVSLNVMKSTANVGNKSYSTIKQYKVGITGPGIAEPIEAFFDGTEESGTVDGIPVGVERIVRIEAINNNQQIIREGLQESVTIHGGSANQLSIEMDAVPIFVNLQDGNSIAGNRIRFELFSDPQDSLEIIDLYNSSSSQLVDASSSSSEIYPNITTGTALFMPVGMLAGEHQFSVVSRRTGKLSTINIKVLDGAVIRPAPLYSGGNTVAGQNISRVGSSFFSAKMPMWGAQFASRLLEY